MALVVTDLQNNIKNAYLKNVPDATESQIAQINKMAFDLSQAIDSYIKSATITSIPLLMAGSVPVTGTITNTIT